MNPAFSVISFTTLLGAGQGLVVILALAEIAGMPTPHRLALMLIALVTLTASLAASFLHLGHPLRAWRAMAMWKTSWLSREVIILPAFIALVGLWAFMEWQGEKLWWLAFVLIGLSVVLWICTAMIYACIRFIREWAHPITLANYTLLGLASGAVLTSSLMALLEPDWPLLTPLAGLAIVATAVAALVRAASLWRNATLRPSSTLQSATGIAHPVLRQTSMGMSAGAFNTREFFHGKSAFVVKNIRAIMWLLCFLVPCLLLLAGIALDAKIATTIAFPVQYAGLLAERWLFFAQARHPQNLYYQTVS